MAVPPLRNIRAQAAPLHGAGAPQANKKDARNIKATVPPQGGGSVKGEPWRFPLCVISGHRAPRCTGQVFPKPTKKTPEGGGFVRKSSPLGFCNRPE